MRPVIAETGYEFVKDKNFNTLNIYIDARPSSDLAWESLESEIEVAIKLNAKLSFELDFGFSEKKALLRDSAAFFSRGLAVNAFSERVYSKYKSQIAAIILYRGSGDFTDSISSDASLYTDFYEWKRAYFGEEALSKQMFRLFSMELLMQNLHRLSASLIDDVPLIALFDLKDTNRPSYQAELLSKSFFPYILPGVKHANSLFSGFGWQDSGDLGMIGHKSAPLIPRNPPFLGVVLPEMGKVPYDLFDQAVTLLNDSRIDYVIFPELLMIESWHGLDYILVFSEAVSREGRRMLQGFNAADGKVISVGEKLGLDDEILFEEFIRSRGI